jgi:hypothetical protein
MSLQLKSSDRQTSVHRVASPPAASAAHRGRASPSGVRMDWARTALYLLAWVLVGAFALAGNWITYKTAPDAAVLGGMAIIVGVV